MGDFTEHVLFGFLSAAVLSYFFKQWLVIADLDILVAAVAVFIGSVLPDIDNKSAYIHRAVKAFTSIAAGTLAFVFFPASIQTRYAAAVGALLLVYSAFSVKKIRHRGITHTLSFSVTVSALVMVGSTAALGSILPGIAAGVGLLSHLVLDGEVL